MSNAATSAAAAAALAASAHRRKAFAAMQAHDPLLVAVAALKAWLESRPGDAEPVELADLDHSRRQPAGLRVRHGGRVRFVRLDLNEGARPTAWVGRDGHGLVDDAPMELFKATGDPQAACEVAVLISGACDGDPRCMAHLARIAGRPNVAQWIDDLGLDTEYDPSSVGMNYPPTASIVRELLQGAEPGGFEQLVVKLFCEPFDWIQTSPRVELPEG